MKYASSTMGNHRELVWYFELIKGKQKPTIGREAKKKHHNCRSRSIVNQRNRISLIWEVTVLAGGSGAVHKSRYWKITAYFRWRLPLTGSAFKGTLPSNEVVSWYRYCAGGISEGSVQLFWDIYRLLLEGSRFSTCHTRVFFVHMYVSMVFVIVPQFIPIGVINASIGGRGSPMKYLPVITAGTRSAVDSIWKIS